MWQLPKNIWVEKKSPGVTDLFILHKVFFHLIFDIFSNTLVIFTL